MPPLQVLPNGQSNTPAADPESIQAPASSATPGVAGSIQAPASSASPGIAGGIVGVAAPGGVLINSENAFIDMDVSDLSGYTLSNASVAYGEDSVTLASSTGSTVYTMLMTAASPPAAGDYVIDVKFSSTRVSGSYVSLQLGGAGDGRLIISLGYNWATSSSQLDRVSFAVKNGGSLTGLAGPSIDYSANDVRVRMEYRATYGEVNIFMLIAAEWVLQGSLPCDVPFDNDLRVSSGGNHASSVTFYRATYSRPNFVAIGDSTTAGHNYFDPQSSHYPGLDDYGNSWQPWAELDLEGINNTMIVNYGVGGDDSSEILARIPAMLANAEPALVFLQCGTNDYGGGAGISNEDRLTNIQTSVDLILASGAVCVLLNSIYPNSNHVNYPGSYNYYSNWWANYKDQVTGCLAKLDLNEAIVGESSDLEADGIHPTAAGYAKIGAYIKANTPTASVPAPGAVLPVASTANPASPGSII